MLEILKGRTDALEPTLVTLADASDVFRSPSNPAPGTRHPAPGTEFIYMPAG